MDTKIQHVKKIFWGWEDDKEEAWLRSMAQQGWHLTKANWGLYTFQQGPARDVVYRMDYITTTNQKDRAQYYQVFQDAGWEHAGELFGWQYFRKEVRPGEADEIYTDSESKIQKYNRLLLGLIVVLPLLASPVNFAITHEPSPGRWIMMAICIIAILFEIFMLTAILRRIQQLKRL